eukprot:CAMPEP_0195293118 /NCGR_PEP_ID=MMETSP0707-20130614/11706_1 /TAXON_ID=33640 /ORGANISM="Asterionellopsis glacialis, Strain CCMP134" /LENGTH=866 /DNA_ID=CAMNT_0040353755 /DNA_START=24 /DNA_END=2624 /DNA_ORIENTATION=+
MSSSNAGAKTPANASGVVKDMNGSADDGSDASSDSNSGRGSGAPAPLSITSDEVNLLVYRYLQESGFVHAAFTFSYESMLGRSTKRNSDKIPPGALISFLQKGLQYVGIEESLHRAEPDVKSKANDVAPDSDDFTLLSSHAIKALTRRNPPIQLNVPPATAAAAIKARLEAEAKLDADKKKAAIAAVSEASARLNSAQLTTEIPSQQSYQQQNAQQIQQMKATSAIASQAAAAHAAAASAMSQLQQGGGGNGVSMASSLPAGAAAFAMQQQRAAVEMAALQQQQQQRSSVQSLAAVTSSAALPTEKASTAGASASASGSKGNVVVTEETNNRRGAGKSKKSAKSKGKASQQSSGGASPKPTPSSTANRQQRQQASEALLEAVARLEAKNEGLRQPSGPAPMDVEENDQRGKAANTAAHSSYGQYGSAQAPTKDLVNGQTQKGGDQNGAAESSAINNNTQPNGKVSHLAPKENQNQSEQDPKEPVTDIVAEHKRIDLEDEKTKVVSSEVLELSKHASEVFMCAWNPIYTDLIATGSGDASARIWQMGGSDASSGCGPVRLLPHGTDPNDRKNKDVTTLEWSSDGKLLATGSYDGVARVWSRTGSLVHTLRGHRGPIFSLKWNRRGNFLLSGSYDKTTIVWDVSGSTGFVEQQFNDHVAPALDVDWKDETTFASCSTDKTVHICRVGHPRPLKTYTGHTDEVNAVKWDPSGRLLASCSDDCTAKVWDVSSERNEPLHDFKSHQQEIYTVKWSPTGPGSNNPNKPLMLATASFDGSVRLWNVQNGTCIRVFSRHRDSVYSVAFSPSGEFLASGSLAGQLYIWNVREGTHIKSFKGKGDIFEVAWNMEETRVAACFSSNTVSVIDFKSPS